LVVDELVFLIDQSIHSVDNVLHSICFRGTNLLRRWYHHLLFFWIYIKRLIGVLFGQIFDEFQWTRFNHVWHAYHDLAFYCGSKIVWKSSNVSIPTVMLKLEW